MPNLRSKGHPKGPTSRSFITQEKSGKGPNAKRSEHLPGTIWKRATKSTTGKNSPYGAKNKAGEIRYFKTPYAAKRFASE